MITIAILFIVANSMLGIWATKNYRNSIRAEEMAKYQPESIEWNEILKYVEI